MNLEKLKNSKVIRDNQEISVPTYKWHDIEFYLIKSKFSWESFTSDSHLKIWTGRTRKECLENCIRELEKVGLEKAKELIKHSLELRIKEQNDKEEEALEKEKYKGMGSPRDVEMIKKFSLRTQSGKELIPSVEDIKICLGMDLEEDFY